MSRARTAAALVLALAPLACVALVGVQPITYADPEASDARPDAVTSDGPETDAEPAEVRADVRDGDAGDPCSGATFCDSFERGNPKGAWDQVVVLSGVLSCSTVRARAGASSLRSSLPASLGSFAYMTKLFGPARRVRFAFSFFVGAATTRTVNLTALGFQGEAGQAENISTRLVAGRLVFSLIGSDGVGAPTSSDLDSVPLTPGTWVDVVVSVDLSASPQQLSLTVNGAPRLVGVAFPRSVAAEITGISAGAYAGDGNAEAIDVDTDVVRVDLE